MSEQILICKICKKEFLSDYVKQTCSKECASVLRKQVRKQVFLEKYGVSNPFQAKEVKEKIKQTCLERYGVEHVSQSDDVKSKMKQTCLERFGVENPLQSKEIKEKVKQTCLERYNGNAPACSKVIKDKSRQTCLERYDSEFYVQTDQFKDKSRQTCLERYDSEFYVQTDQFKDKSRQTLFNRYSTIFPSQTKVPLHIRSQEWWDQRTNFLEAKNLIGTYLSESNQYLYAHQFRPDWEFKSSISSHHQRIIDLLTDNKIDHETNTRKIISPLELDIFIPSKNLAIEVNGVYWHSELAGGKDKNYHLNKTLECEKKGIQLLQFWDYEVEQKWEIVKSMILNKLGFNKNKISARKCFIVNLNSSQSKDFCNATHLQGFRPGSRYIGLIHNNNLVSLLILGKSRYNKQIEYEILRFSTQLNIIVIGGFSKLAHSIYHPLVSYADRRYSLGKVYQSSGWTLINQSSPSYYYTNNYQTLHHRSAYQKHKLSRLLETFDPSKTEWDNMVLNGWDRIWDCGSLVWLKE